MRKKHFFDIKGNEVCISFICETKEEWEWLDKNDICEEDEEGTNDMEAVKELERKIRKRFPVKDVY